MILLNEIIPVLKSGSESLGFSNKNTEFSLVDFWRWSISDLISNATRGRLAEFIVATALGFDRKHIRDEWGPYDLDLNNIKIEVKSAAYIQSWQQNDYSPISFSIKKSLFWDSKTTVQNIEKKRWADVYVFCLLKEKDQNIINPLHLEQWEFYVLPTNTLNNYERSQSSITLNSLRKKSDAVSYLDLNEKVTDCFLEEMI